MRSKIEHYIMSVIVNLIIAVVVALPYMLLVNVMTTKNITYIGSYLVVFTLMMISSTLVYILDAVKEIKRKG